MLAQIEALRALAELGTTARAATRLRLTQSAVSKRIAALEVEVGVPLVVKSGRRVRLTGAAEDLLRTVSPHVYAIQSQVSALKQADTSLIRIAATESLLGAWLPAELRAVQSCITGLTLELHAHRGPVAVRRVQASEVDVAVCVAGGEEDLASLPLGDEAMVLVASGDSPPPHLGPVDTPVWTIEPASLTGAWLARRLPRLPWRIVPTARIESFSSAVQLARAGYGHALVPAGIAAAMGVPANRLVPVPGLARPLVLCFRPRSLERSVVRTFATLLAGRLTARLAGGPDAPAP